MKIIVSLFLVLILVLLVLGATSCQLQHVPLVHPRPLTMERAQREVQRRSTADQRNRQYYQIPNYYQVPRY